MVSKEGTSPAIISGGCAGGIGFTYHLQPHLLEIETNIVDAGVKAPRIGELEAYIETYLKDCV